MTLPSTRRGNATINYAGGAVTLVPLHDKVAQLEKDLKLDFPEILDAMMTGNKPFYFVDIIYHLQVGSSYSKNEIREWLFGDVQALQQDPLKTNLAQVLATVAGFDYDAQLAKVMGDEKKEETPPTA